MVFKYGLLNSRVVESKVFEPKVGLPGVPETKLKVTKTVLLCCKNCSSEFGRPSLEGIGQDWPFH